MKKNLKTLAVLSAAAVMTVAAPEMGLTGAVGTAFAKDIGWVEGNDTWRYYEEDDYFVSDEWKKRGEDWYYLDEDGNLAVNAQIDGYYVNEEGKRVMNQWVSIENEKEWDTRDLPDVYWYYYGRNGQAITAKWFKIDDNWHYFDEEGRMLTGKVEIEGDTYYLGDENDGKMKYGWIELENETEDPDITHSWYYFEKDGKMVVNQVDKKIAGDYYTFEDGVMQTGWYKLPAAETETATPSDADAAAQDKSSAADYQYYDPDNGKRVTGWRTMEGAPGVSLESEIYTFYFKNGKPYYAEDGIEIFTVDSKRYAFNEKGEMQTDLQSVMTEEGAKANYYFGDDGVMRTGKQTIFDEESGENKIWYFHTDGYRKGQGFHGVRDNNVFSNGLKLEADSDLRVAPVALDEVTYLVNSNGAIQKASSSSKSSVKPELGNGYKDIKDSNDKIWVVDVNGLIQ